VDFVKNNSEKWVEQLVAEGESEQVEFKQRLDDEAIETLAAFANARGGTLFVGIADDGTVKGGDIRARNNT